MEHQPTRLWSRSMTVEKILRCIAQCPTTDRRYFAGMYLVFWLIVFMHLHNVQPRDLLIVVLTQFLVIVNIIHELWHNNIIVLLQYYYRVLDTAVCVMYECTRRWANNSRWTEWGRAGWEGNLALVLLVHTTSLGSAYSSDSSPLRTVFTEEAWRLELSYPGPPAWASLAPLPSIMASLSLATLSIILCMWGYSSRTISKFSLERE